jgi:hypothetical protein
MADHSKLISNNDTIQKLFVKGLKYTSDNHVYKLKDYCECVFDTQIQSKEWMVSTIRDLGYYPKHVTVLAGWYGMVIIPLLYKAFGEIKIDLYDVDEYTIDIASHVFNDWPNVNLFCKDVVFDEIDFQGDLLINSSCEHMMDMKEITEANEGKVFVYQSNNNRNVKWLHINCVEETNELVEQAGLTRVFYAGSCMIYRNKRIMVIGQ